MLIDRLILITHDNLEYFKIKKNFVKDVFLRYIPIKIIGQGIAKEKSSFTSSSKTAAVPQIRVLLK